MTTDTLPRLYPLMLGGTGSDVGKSVLAAGLCRIFRQDGYNPAPFKAQNMALNSYVTPDGLEIGRAQAVQAEACGIACSSDMNPLLLKPQSDHKSQVVLDGKPIGTQSAYSYFRAEGREWLRARVHEAFSRLSSSYNPIVMEGAGSIAEINLQSSDLVNMPMAEYAGAKVVLVADIDRGGVFASAYGSIMLQPERYRRLIKGIIVNKFRGDMRLFETGRQMMEQVCGVPVLGVVPYLDGLDIEQEDSVELTSKRTAAVSGKVNVAVVRLPHISNFTDFNTLERNAEVNLYYTDSPDEIVKADAVILPGSKSTIADLLAIRANGVADAVIAAAGSGKLVAGICGGYQMMGERVDDPDGVEGEPMSVDGLGLLPTVTVLTPDKVTRRVEFALPGSDNHGNRGYEIHMGRTTVDSHRMVEPAAILADGTPDGCVVGANCVGTYLHGLFDNAEVLNRWFTPLGCGRFTGPGVAEYNDSQYNRLASELRRYIYIPLLYKIMMSDD